MKAYISNMRDGLMLTLDSENKEEAEKLMELANRSPRLSLTSTGSTLEEAVRIQYIQTLAVA